MCWFWAGACAGSEVVQPVNLLEPFYFSMSMRVTVDSQHSVTIRLFLTCFQHHDYGDYVKLSTSVAPDFTCQHPNMTAASFSENSDNLLLMLPWISHNTLP